MYWILKHDYHRKVYIYLSLCVRHLFHIFGQSNDLYYSKLTSTQLLCTKYCFNYNTLINKHFVCSLVQCNYIDYKIIQQIFFKFRKFVSSQSGAYGKRRRLLHIYDEFFNIYIDNMSERSKLTSVCSLVILFWVL